MNRSYFRKNKKEADSNMLVLNFDKQQLLNIYNQFYNTNNKDVLDYKFYIYNHWILIDYYKINKKLRNFEIDIDKVREFLLLIYWIFI